MDCVPAFLLKKIEGVARMSVVHVIRDGGDDTKIWYMMYKCKR